MNKNTVLNQKELGLVFGGDFKNELTITGGSRISCSGNLTISNDAIKCTGDLSIESDGELTIDGLQVIADNLKIDVMQDVRLI